MIIAKNFRDFRKSQASGGRSCHSQLISPIVEHAAQLLDRAGEELLLLLGKPGGREGEELLPVRVAGEQIGVPPDVAGLDRFALGVGETRQGMLRHAEDRLGDPVSPEGC